MTNAELIARINANIKANGREQINGEELNFILRQILGLIVSAGANWGDIDGNITDQTDLISLLNGKFDDPTGTTSQYIRGDGSLQTFPTIPDVTGLQSKPVVVNSSLTAQNDTVYHVVANATFTDPTPAEGRGYVVFVRNGTATIGGIPFSTAGNFIYRLFHSGGWASYPFGNINSLSTIFNAAYVPQTRTINGKALTSNVTLTPSDIGAPSGSGTSTGTNTGDESQYSILSKLGSVLRKAIGSSTVTGTGETLVATFTVNPNELSATDMLRWFASSIKSGTAGQQQLRLKHSTSNDFTTADQIAVFNATTLSNININVRRDTFTIEGGQLSGFSFTTSAITDNTNNNNANGSKAFDVSVTNYFFVTIQLTNGSDTARLRSSKLSNI